jgi:serine/threonine-protein kinase
MATVHLGRLLGHVGFERTVAIKRLHAHFAQDPDFVSMFLDEARVVARIRHPNVVPTLDVVAVEGELFIVMEYVPGESLARLIKAAGAQGARIPPPFVATLLAGVLHGIHAAHEATSERGEPLGVVHRDISPQNILVGTDGVARVLDFGVAKAAGRLQTTREGQLKGKIAYMAPEQVSGEVGRASDIYSASVVLWEALTGRRLFAGTNEGHVVKLVLENRVPPPSEIVSDLPSVLDALTLRGLSRDPADRFATAQEMALALEDALPPVAPSRIGAWVQATAPKTLDDRRERVAAIESHSSMDVARVGDPSPALGARQPATAVVPAASLEGPARAIEEIHTQLSSSASAERATGGSSRRGRMLIAIGCAAVTVAVVAVLSLRRGPHAAPDVAGEVAPPVAPAASPSTALVGVAPAPSQLPAVPSSAVSSASVGGVSPPASTAAHPVPRRPRTVTPRAPASPVLDDGTSDRK